MHGTSGCILTKEEWAFVIDVLDNTLSNLQSFRKDSPNRQQALIDKLGEIMDKLP
jgi:hypothetical protein